MSCSEENLLWGRAARAPPARDTRPPGERRDVGKRRRTKGRIQANPRAVNNLITSREMVSGPRPRRGGLRGSWEPGDEAISRRPQGCPPPRPHRGSSGQGPPFSRCGTVSAGRQSAAAAEEIRAGTCWARGSAGPRAPGSGRAATAGMPLIELLNKRFCQDNNKKNPNTID